MNQEQKGITGNYIKEKILKGKAILLFGASVEKRRFWPRFSL